MKLRSIPYIFAAALALASCSAPSSDWSAAEKSLIEEAKSAYGEHGGSRSPFRVLTVESPEDLAVLRDSCATIGAEALRSPLYPELKQLMIASVTAPEQDGVGIAGPQVGLSRRIVAVQRLDKEGEPFEVYPNIRITAMRGEKVEGGEGCLSVPGRRGTVARYRDIDIAYTFVPEQGEPCDTVETVQGFTAVIFQHECDHLDGVLYTDRVSEVTIL